MRHIFCLLFFLLTFFSINGQINNSIDSLNIELKDISIEKEKRVDVLNELGYKYWVVDSKKSINYGKEALELAEKLSYSNGIAMAKRVLGVAYWTLGKPKLALENLTEAQKEYKEINDEEGEANCLMNAGMVYADLEDYDKALKIYDKSIEKFTKLNLKSRVATTFTKIGTVLIQQNKLDKAKEYLTNALNMHSENNYVYGIGEANNRLGNLFLLEGELEQAEYYINKAILTSKSINDEDGLIGGLILSGKLLRLRNDFVAAEVNLNLALNKATEKQLRKYKLDAYRELKILKKNQGKLNESLTYYDKFIALKDSIYNIDKSKQIAALEFSNELKDKDKELILLQEKERSSAIIKWSLFGGIIGLAIISLLIIGGFRQRATRDKEFVKRKQELLISKEELAKTALENAHLKQQELQQELDFKNKELTSYALNFVQKNELLQQLQEKVSLTKNASHNEKGKLIGELGRIIKQHVNIDRDWEDFKRFFEEVHIDFHKKLQIKHPDLSSNDLKICILTRLNLNTKETASILGISPESAKTARYRLRKKLNLSPENELLHYFLELEKA